jgi:hypothetical protein
MHVIILFMTSAVVAFSQSYKVTPERIVKSEINCYSFEAPENWNIATGNTAPYFINFSPKKLVPIMAQLPNGGAQMGVASAKDARNGVKSIDQWMRLRRRAYAFTSVQETHFPPETGITRAVMVSWTNQKDIEPGNPITESVAVYFVFRSQPFQAEVDFNSNDRKKDVYVKTLSKILESFRPLEQCPSQ